MGIKCKHSTTPSTNSSVTFGAQIALSNAKGATFENGAKSYTTKKSAKIQKPNLLNNLFKNAKKNLK